MAVAFYRWCYCDSGCKFLIATNNFSPGESVTNISLTLHTHHLPLIKLIQEVNSLAKKGSLDYFMAALMLYCWRKTRARQL